MSHRTRGFSKGFVSFGKWLAGLCILVYSSATAADQPPSGISVSTVECADLDADTIKEIFVLEITQALPSPNNLTDMEIEIQCTESVIVIGIWDPLTDKKLERRLESAQSSPTGKNRVIAIAASQLYLASWLELLISHPLPTPSGDAPRETSVRAATNLVTELVVPKPGPGEAALGAGARAHALNHDVLFTTHIGLHAGAWTVSKIGIFATTGFDFGRKSKTLGDVDAYKWSLGARAARKWQLHNTFGIQLGIDAAAVYALLIGTSRLDEIVEGRVRGFSGEFSIHVAPLFTFGKIATCLMIEAGYGIDNPIAEVLDSVAVTLGGVFVGANLTILLFFG